MSQFYVYFEPLKTLKARVFVDFIEKMILVASKPTPTWIMFIEWSTYRRVNNTSLILENDVNLIIEVSLIHKEKPHLSHHLSVSRHSRA